PESLQNLVIYNCLIINILVLNEMFIFLTVNSDFNNEINCTTNTYVYNTDSYSSCIFKR
ncbi:hypothetical protein C803_02038, partial [Parabacteroides goldsteinii dnLKV18]